MFVVFDIGGTNLRAAGVVPGSDRLGTTLTVDTPNFFEADDIDQALSRLLKVMAGIVEEIARGASVTAICVGFPGPIARDGSLLAAPTIWGRQAIDRFPLATLLSQTWPHIPAEVVNDITAAGHNYVDDDMRDFLIATVGSGVGSKLFLDGEPVLGPHARGGEIGHLRVDFSDDAPLCDCGGVGHLGAIASGRGVRRMSFRRAAEAPRAFRESKLFELCDGDPENLTNELFAEAFRSGDSWACDTLRECSRPLAQAFAAVHLHAGIEKFVIIGGFAQALGDPYRRLLCEIADTAMWRNGLAWDSAIELSRIDDMPGLRGAAKLLQRRYG